MSPTRYDVRVEPAGGFNLTTGEKWSGVRVRYRRLGSRGRFESFLVVAPLPDPFDPFQAVKLYEASKPKREIRPMAKKKEEKKSEPEKSPTSCGLYPKLSEEQKRERRGG